MLEEKERTILQRILEATRNRTLVWEQHFDGYYCANIGAHNEKVMIRRMFIEATNQVGADPYFVDFHMPGWNTRFAITGDSEGWRLIQQILDAAFDGKWNNSVERAISFLDVHLP
jgi:hypothetical protein